MSRMWDSIGVSVIIPSKGGEYLEYTLRSLANQTIRPSEIILILKSCDISKIEIFCRELELNAIIKEQISGYFTAALNIGKSIANEDIIVFTDDDIIAPVLWIENYLKLFNKITKRIGSLSGRDIYYDMRSKKIKKSPDDLIRNNLFRKFVRPIIDPPHPVMIRYGFGSYISKKYNFVIGKDIPGSICYSLPFRGVNMAFRREAIENIWFFEHPELKRGFRNEHHFGLQMLLNGYDSLFIPSNPVYHIMRSSLSRVRGKEEYLQLMYEEEIIRRAVKILLEKVK